MTFVSIKRLSFFFSVRLDSKFISFLFSPYSCYVVKVATNNWLLTFFSLFVSLSIELELTRKRGLYLVIISQRPKNPEEM